MSMEKYRASKLLLEEVPLAEEREFLNLNHYQKYAASQQCYGLYDNEQLLCLMSFSKPRYRKDYDYELLRLCTKKGCTVHGGASRLFKHFLELNPNCSVISYCNEDLFEGKVYQALGFVKKSVTRGYHYEKDGKSWHRSNFQKHKLVEKYPEWSHLTEFQIMEKLGYERVADKVGQARWTYEPSEGLWYVYAVRINGYEYIGQHKYKDIDEEYNGSGTILMRMQKKYGTLGEKTILASGLTREEANRCERCMIFCSRLTSKNINIQDGGQGYVKTRSCYAHNSHHGSNSEAMKERWQDSEFREKMSIAHKDNPLVQESLSKAREKSARFAGHKHSEESRKKMRESIEKAKAEGKNVGGNRVAGMRWWTDGKKNKRAVECPGEGWRLGRSS